MSEFLFNNYVIIGLLIFIVFMIVVFKQLKTSSYSDELGYRDIHTSNSDKSSENEDPIDKSFFDRVNSI